MPWMAAVVVVREACEKSRCCANRDVFLMRIAAVVAFLTKRATQARSPGERARSYFSLDEPQARHICFDL
jgi:hypothetical protein